MKQYDRYKDSGVEWLGKVPEHWRLFVIRAITRLKSDKGHSNYEVLSVYREYGVIKKDTRDDNHNATSQETITYKAVNPTDLVINKMKAWQGSMGISPFKGIVSPAYITCEINKEIVHCDYLHYLLRSSRYIDEYNRLSYGVRIGQWDMHYEDFKQIIVSLPTVWEQENIASFLDQKCIQIDKAISQKEKVIELLNERRQVIIQRAVTRGLDPNVPMKSSGVDWIGEIPEHWEVKKLKFLTSKIGSGVTPTGGSSVYRDTGIPLLRSQNIHFDKIDLSDVACISPFIDSTMSNTRVREGDVLLNITGGSIGRCYYVKNDLGPANVNQHVCILRPNKFQTLFLYYLMRSNIGQTQIELEQTGGNREGLTFAALKNFIFPTTLSKVQEDITNYLNQVNIQIDSAISIKRQEIEKLKEYKTVLIDAAVTGKIKIA